MNKICFFGLFLSHLTLASAFGSITNLEKFDYIAMYFCDQKNEAITRVVDYKKYQHWSDDETLKYFRSSVLSKGFRKHPDLYRKILVLAKFSKRKLVDEVTVLVVSNEEFVFEGKKISLSDLKKLLPRETRKTIDPYKQTE